MRPIHLAVLIAVAGTPLAKGQAGYRDPNFIPRVNVALGYNLVRSNAPPANCNCFGMNGGFASVGVAVRPWLSGAAEFTGSHGNHIGPLGQDLTLTTYTGGPRVTMHYSRFTPFGQAMFGYARGTDSYFPRSASTYSTSAGSFAYSLGGGVDFKLSERFDIRPVQLQYLHTSFPNGTNDSQNHLVYGAAIVVKFGSHTWTPDPGRARHNANKAMRAADQAALAPPVPPKPVPPPPPPPPTEAVASPPPPTAPTDFHAHVPDVYFDDNSSTLRPDARRSVQMAAAWLQSHPDNSIEIGGYADERGTDEYNLLLAGKRADATRDALVSAGVPVSRLAVHSYGKMVQTCDGKQESCYRQNRRAAFNLQP